MSEVNNGSLLKRINDSVVRMETQNIAVNATLVEIKGILKTHGDNCEATCRKNENRFGSIFSQIKIQWFVIGGFVLATIGFAFFIFRAAG